MSIPGPVSLIANRTVHAGLHVHAVCHVGLGQHDATRLDHDLATLRHAVARVDGQIQHDSTHLTRVDVDRRKPLFRNHLQFDPLTERVCQNGFEIRENGVQAQPLWPQHLTPREGQELIGEARRPHRRIVSVSSVNPPGLPSGSPFMASSDDTSTTVSRLLKLCATPPASRPIASNWCAFLGTACNSASRCATRAASLDDMW